MLNAYLILGLVFNHVFCSFSYIILASFFGIEVLVVLQSEAPWSAAAGVWVTIFFIYMTYTLLALHIQVSTLVTFSPISHLRSVSANLG